MQVLKKFLLLFDPLFVYYGIIYRLGKIFEHLLGIQSIWQSMWDKMRSTFGDDKEVYTIWILNIYLISLHWILGSAIVVIQKYKGQKILKPYKLQEKPCEIELKGKLVKVIRTIVRNQIIILAVTVLAHKFDKDITGMSISPEVPSLGIVMRDFFICIACYEIFFYYQHRALHHKRLYRFHKQHHEFKTPTWIVAQYSGIVETVLHIGPVTIGPKLMGVHFTTALLLMTTFFLTTFNDHSGYHLPFLKNSKFHDDHHAKFNGNYSIYGIMDKLHGTYFKKIDEKR